MDVVGWDCDFDYNSIVSVSVSGLVVSPIFRITLNNDVVCLSNVDVVVVVVGGVGADVGDIVATYKTIHFCAKFEIK